MKDQTRQAPRGFARETYVANRRVIQSYFHCPTASLRVGHSLPVFDPGLPATDQGLPWLGWRQSARLAQLHGLQSNETLARWADWAHTRALSPLFDELMAEHYDPLYARSQNGNFPRLRDAVRIEAERLAPEDMASLADRILAMERVG